MPPTVDRLSGSEVQGWCLGKVIGNGADGVVYSAEGKGRSAAVKIFFPENLQKEEWSGARDRLELQLSLKGEKHHPNLVEVIDGGELEEYSTIYLVMEYVPGSSLDKICGKIPPEVVQQLIWQLASACKWLEDRGLAHRDIKPANIVISEDFSQLTLLDLGVIHWLPTDGDGRLSGDEFVATTASEPTWPGAKQGLESEVSPRILSEIQ
ncbi:serine/threonine protein kinase [Pseudoxanthomonas sp. UTMC 1351]|uniref:serine/threonine protein kinase n=1 Tax=Pseudoxanthomonas sp. UTMC 1351 TaxID=2695853 RepID=UPI0034CDCEBD